MIFSEMEEYGGSQFRLQLSPSQSEKSQPFSRMSQKSQGYAGTTEGFAVAEGTQAKTKESVQKEFTEPEHSNDSSKCKSQELQGIVWLYCKFLACHRRAQTLTLG